MCSHWRESSLPRLPMDFSQGWASPMGHTVHWEKKRAANRWRKGGEPAPPLTCRRRKRRTNYVPPFYSLERATHWDQHPITEPGWGNPSNSSSSRGSAVTLILLHLPGASKTTKKERWTRALTLFPREQRQSSA